METVAAEFGIQDTLNELGIKPINNGTSTGAQ